MNARKLIFISYFLLATAVNSHYFNFKDDSKTIIKNWTRKRIKKQFYEDYVVKSKNLSDFIAEYLNLSIENVYESIEENTIDDIFENLEKDFNNLEIVEN